MPSGATVGDKGLAGSLTLTNLNTSPDTDAAICNAGEAAPCPSGGGGITLLPSCRGQDAVSLGCVPPPNPGVFEISSTATGALGTACAGVTFTVTPLGDGFGTVGFDPTGGRHIVLPDPGSTCRIDFKVDVVNAPFDVDPSLAGYQTYVIADAAQRSSNKKTAAANNRAVVTVLTPPTTPPPTTPPTTPPPAPPTTPSSGGMAPKAVKGSVAPGTAKINGKSGCVTKNFNVTVTGRQIRRVVFTLDGKPVKTLTKPNAGSTFSLPVKPGQLKKGTHRVVAQTTFTTASGTRPRSLRVAFSRCERSGRAPQFTG
jgi:hypothetical protein